MHVVNKDGDCVRTGEGGSRRGDGDSRKQGRSILWLGSLIGPRIFEISGINFVHNETIITR